MQIIIITHTCNSFTGKTSYSNYDDCIIKDVVNVIQMTYFMFLLLVGQSLSPLMLPTHNTILLSPRNAYL